MKKSFMDTLDTVNKVVKTVDQVAKTANEVTSAISNTAAAMNNLSNALGKSSGLDKTSGALNQVSGTANQVMAVVNSLVSGSDMEYLAQQSTSNLNNILAGMTGLMNNNNMKTQAMESQVWYQRMINTVSGKNKSTVKEIRQNHDHLNAYMSEAIAELYNRDCIDHRIIMSLGNQINDLYRENNQLKQMLGAFVVRLNEKIDSIDNFHILNVEIMQGVYSNSAQLEAICKVLSQIDKRTLTDRRKMEIIERSLSDRGILSDQKIRLKEYLLSLDNLSQENVGIIYIDQRNTYGNFMSNIIINIFDEQNYLFREEVEVNYVIDRMDAYIMEQKLNCDLEMSTIDIFNNFIQSKIDKMNGLSPISPIQYASMLADGEASFMGYRMDEAYEIYNTLAEKGVVRAMYFLHQLYLYGYGNIQYDEENDNRWITTGYESDDVLASVNYAWIVEDQSVSVQIFNWIFPRMLELAEQGDVFAQYEVSQMYYYGYGTDQNLEERIYWLRQSSDRGYFKAIADLAGCYYEGEGVNQDYNTALSLFKVGAEIGEPYCQDLIGNFYYSGELVEQDYAEAFKWYKKSAEQSYQRGQSHLADCYRNGTGVNRNYNEAFKWYLMAAENGYNIAQYQTACCYYYGEGTKLNISKGLSWYKKAADEGEGRAMLALGDYYANGIFKDKLKAFNYYKKAGELGFERGQNELGNCYKDGFGTMVDHVKAIEWYLKSAEQGFAGAMKNLGYVYYTGIGVKRDLNEAVKWFTKGAEAGSEVSQLALADFYYSGIGVGRNIDTAREWYIKSALQGEKDAIKALKKYYKIKL